MDPRAEAILAWINSFEVVEGTLSDVIDLYDSVLLGKVLAEIDPFFNDLQSVLVVGEDISWTEKASNLDKIKLALATYYSRLLLKGFKVEDDIDTSAIAKGRGFDDFINLMELVFGAAAMCSKHNHFDQQILKLSETTRLYLQELRENIIINTYDLVNIKDKDDMSDLSNDSDTCSDSDNESDFDANDGNNNKGYDLFLHSANNNNNNNKRKGREKEEDTLLQRHLQIVASLEIMKNTNREHEVEKTRLLKLITSLREANSSLQEDSCKQNSYVMKLEEKTRTLQASNTSFQLKISSLTSQVQSAESHSLALEKDMSSMKEEVKAAKQLQLKLEKASEMVEIYKHKVDCLTPVISINDHLEASLKDAQAQLEEVELAVSTRIRLEDDLRTTDLEDLQKKHKQMSIDFLSCQERLEAVTHANNLLTEELKVTQLLDNDHEKLKDELSLQCIHSMKLEQTIDSHKAIFRQYKTLIKDSYQIIQDLQAAGNKNYSQPGSKKTKIKTPTKTKKVATPTTTQSQSQSQIQIQTPILTSAPASTTTDTDTNIDTDIGTLFATPITNNDTFSI